MDVYLLGDVDAIKDFVFETSSLPQIRGGSQLLLECEDEVVKKIESLGGEKIYCSGGSFLFKVPLDKVEAAKRDIQDIYTRHTLVATVTIASENGQALSTLAKPPEDGWAKRLWDAHQQIQAASDFARRIAFLSAQVRNAKVQKRIVPFFESFPFGKRCDTCGKRIAQEEVARYEPEELQQEQREPPPPEKIALCAVCLRRHEQGKTSQIYEIRGRFNERFYREYGPRSKQPPDLDHLAQSAPRKYIAFLYADGNDIGKLLQQVSTEDEFKALSTSLEMATQQALFDALHGTCNHELQNANGYWPFEIVNIGGDDVTLLIQAGYAWEVAVRFLEEFERSVQRLIREKLGYWPTNWPAKITASCGIAVADVKYPVRYMEYLASDLLKHAKKEAKANPSDPQSAVNFLWLPNPIAVEKVEPLMAYYHRNSNRLTSRPYILEQAKELMELVQEALVQRTFRWPRSLRYRWGEALDKGVEVSLNLIYYDIARKKEDERRALYGFIERVSKLATKQQYQTTSPGHVWQIYEEDGQKRGMRTALLDVLELAELRSMRPDVQEEEEES